MPQFSKASEAKLLTCDKRLQTIFFRVIEDVDLTIICGHRTKEEQEKAFKEGKSKLNWPKSKHNSYPSMAVDVICFPINWDDLARCQWLAMEIVFPLAHSLGIGLRWGGDWDGDGSMKNERFIDAVHFELT